MRAVPSPPDQPPIDAIAIRVLRLGEAIGEFIAWWGFKRIHGRIWTLLVLSREPRTQAEIARILGVSRALVSSAIHELDGYGLVRAVGEGRQAPWEGTLDVWPVIADVLRQREWILIEQVRVALEAVLEEAELEEAELEGDSAWDIERMRLLMGLTDMAQRFLRLFLALRVPRTVPSLADWLGKATGVLAALRRPRD